MPSDTGPAALVRQGIVEAWDADTGANTIRVAGGTLQNVTAHKAGAATMQIGDTVLLLSAGNKWVLLGTATTPGDPGTVPTWNVDITALTGQVDTIQTVTIPAVQNDVTIVQGDVIELNTVTIPAVQADVTTAQTTANNASSAAATAASAAAAAQDAATALDTRLDAAESDVATAQSDITTLTGTTLPALQTQVNGILPITETKISDDAITTPKIAAGAITAAEIAASAVTTSALAANAVTAAKITAGTITATELAAGAVTAAKLSADAIDGKTITGALIRTAASGQRIEISPSFSLTVIRGFTGNVSETSPGSLAFSSNTGLGSSVISPNLGTGVARVDLSGNGGVGSTPSVTLSANAGNDFSLSASGAKIGTDVIATGTASQTLTNKNLSSATNTFPGIPYSIAVSGTTDASGFLTVTHGAGFTPVGGWWVCTNPGSSPAQFWGIDTITATQARLRFASVFSTAALASSAVTGRLFLVRP